MNDLSYGVVVLSAKRAVNIPVLSSTNMTDHIPGAVFHGRAGGMSASQADVSLPSRGVQYHIYTNRPGETSRLWDLGTSMGNRAPDDDGDLRTFFHNKASEFISIGEHVVLEQTLPFGMVGLHSNEGGLRLYGLYSDACDLLVWTNTPDLDVLLHDFNRKEWRIYRFKERTSFSTIVFTKRVCQRWFRWASTLPSSDVKFQALESSLFNPHER